VLRPEVIIVQGKLRIHNTAIPLAGGIIKLADIEGKGVWSDNLLSHRITMKVFGGSVSVQGNLNFKKNNQGEWDPVIDSNVTPQSLQLASLRPLVQKDWFPRQGTLSGKVHVRGPVKRFSKIKLKGTLAGKKVLLKIKEKPVAFEKTVLSFEPNTQKNMQIRFNLDNISIGELRLKKTTGEIVFLKGAYKLKQGKIWPKTGVLFLNGAYKFETKDYKLDISGKGLRLEDFKDKYLKGPLSLKGSLYGRVLSEGFMKGLSGNFEINSENGKVLKTGGITSKILSALSLSFSLGADKGFPFDFLGGNCTIKKGILSTENFEMTSPSLKLEVSGKTDLSDEKIDLEVIAIPLLMLNKVFRSVNSLIAKSQSGDRGILSTTITKVPIIGGSLAGEEDKEELLDGDKRKESGQPKGLMKFYFSVEGTFEKPNVYFLPKKTSWFK
jgi:hypothetical protein